MYASWLEKNITLHFLDKWFNSENKLKLIFHLKKSNLKNQLVTRTNQLVTRTNLENKSINLKISFSTKGYNFIHGGAKTQMKNFLSYPLHLLSSNSTFLSLHTPPLTFLQLHSPLPPLTFLQLHSLFTPLSLHTPSTTLSFQFPLHFPFTSSSILHSLPPLYFSSPALLCNILKKTSLEKNVSQQILLRNLWGIFSNVNS